MSLPLALVYLYLLLDLAGHSPAFFRSRRLLTCFLLSRSRRTTARRGIRSHGRPTSTGEACNPQRLAGPSPAAVSSSHLIRSFDRSNLFEANGTVYLLGTDDNTSSNIKIAASRDHGATWNPADSAIIANSTTNGMRGHRPLWGTLPLPCVSPRKIRDAITLHTPPSPLSPLLNPKAATKPGQRRR